jgi:hypothetical protein
MNASLIERIRSGSLTEKELINLYNNTKDRNNPNVIAAIERQMRGQFPRAANRLFGKKESFAIERLQEAIALLEGQVNLETNVLKNGIKPGGKKLSGEQYLNVYVSYRNAAGVGAYLSMEQDTIDSELYAVVSHYKIGHDKFQTKRRYTMEAFDEAAAEYVRLVQDVARIV